MTDPETAPRLRWLTQEQYERLAALRPSSVPVNALMAALYRCKSEADFREILVQAVVCMAQGDAEMTKAMLNFARCQPPPPMILVTTEEERARIEKEFADRA